MFLLLELLEVDANDLSFGVHVHVVIHYISFLVIIVVAALVAVVQGCVNMVSNKM